MYATKIILYWILFFYSSVAISQCDLTVDAGPDQELCAPGRTVQLSGTIEPDPIFIRWSPGPSVSDSTILDPSADVFQTTVFTLKGYALDGDGQNLIENGDFEQGDTLFDSDYRSVTGADILDEGTYSLTTSPDIVHSNFPPCDDHTLMNGNGLMMVVNASRASDVDIFCQTVSIQPNTYYQLEVWVTSVFPFAAAELQFKIDGSAVGDSYVVSLDLCDWMPYSILWYSGDLTSVEYCLTDLNTEPFGNDFALDDFSMKELCEITDDVIIQVHPPQVIHIDTVICEGEEIVIDGVVYDQTGQYYDLMVVDDQGCDVIYNLDLHVLTIDILEQFEPDITCLDTLVDIGVFATVSAGNLKFSWTTQGGNFRSDSTQSVVKVDAGGFYELTIEASYRGTVCQEIIQFIIIEDNMAPHADAGPDQTINCDTNIVVLDGSTSSTGVEIIYQWKDPNGTILGDMNTVQVSQAGLYELRVTNIRNGCIDLDTVEVKTSNDFPQINAGKDTMFFCNQNQFTIEPTISNVSTFALEWTTPDGNIVSVVNLTAIVDTTGHYVLTVANAQNMCTSSDTVFVEFLDRLPQVHLTAFDSLDCATASVPISYSYPYRQNNIESLWFGASTFDIVNDSTISTTDSGWYHIVLRDTVYDCLTQDSIYVYQDRTPPIADAGPDRIIRCGDTLHLIGNGSSQGPSYAYLWTTPNGNILGDRTQITARVDQAGIYILEVRDTVNFCIASDTLEVLGSTVAPQIDFVAPDTISCRTPQVHIRTTITNNSPQDIHSWTSPDGNIIGSNSDDSVLVDMGGLYILTVVNAQSLCIDMDTIFVAENINYPIIDAGADDSLSCSISDLQLQATLDDLAGRIILWSSPDGVIDSGSESLRPRVSSGGTYILSVTDIRSGCVSLDTVVIYADQNIPVARIALPDTLYCVPNFVVLDAGASSQGPDFEPDWSTIGGNIVDTTDIYRPIVNAAGQYILRISNQSSGCTSTDTVSIITDQNSPRAVVDIEGTLNCRDSIVTIDASQSIFEHSGTYIWSGPLTGTSTSAEARQPGQYGLRVLDTINLCSDSITFEIIEDRRVPNTIYPEGLSLPCAGARIKISPQDSSMSYTYSWNTADGQITTDPTNAVIEVDQPGLYIVRTTDQNNFCSKLDSVVVDLDSFEVVLELKDPACSGDKGQISIDFLRSTPGIYRLSSDDIGTIDPFVSVQLEPGNYSFKIEHESGCSTLQNILIHEAPTLSIVLDEYYQIQLGEMITLDPKLSFDSSLITMLRWESNNGLTLPGELHPTLKPLETTQYTLMIEVDSQCIVRARTQVIVARPDIFIPDAFTPNGDGSNDYWVIYAGPEVERIEQLRIFNRWGDLIFDRNNTTPGDLSQAWDGTYRGQDQDVGVYVFVIRVRYINGTIKSYKGSLSLLR